MKKESIYLDNNATTPVDSVVIEAMLPYFTERYGNPSSLHSKGTEAERAVSNVRYQLAELLGVKESEVVFTSGATESLNTAILGIARANKRKGRHIVTTAVEHDAVLSSCQVLEEEGWEVSYLKTDQYGMVTPEQVSEVVREDTALVAVMQVNNELGTINPVNDIAYAVKKKKDDVYVVVDGVQAFGKMSVDLTHIDAYAISAHKFHGPKGVGALVVKEGVKQRMKPLIVGGGQEFGIRSGTQNVPAIVGLGKAVELAYSNLRQNRDHIQNLREYLLSVFTQIDDVVINSPESGLETTLNVSFLGVSAETLLHTLEEKGVYFSTGSACSTNNKIKSHVLEHVTDRQDVKNSSVRFGLSRLNTTEEIENASQIVREAVEELRSATRTV
ncbi:MAG: cysteine desulfurase family protein [Candidatus Paceibacterota bacterium]